MSAFDSTADDLPQWLAEMVVPVYEKLVQATEAHENARRQMEAAAEREVVHKAQFGQLVGLAAPLGVTPEQVETFCRRVIAEKRFLDSQPPEERGLKRVANAELMVMVGRILRAAGTTLDVDEIVRALTVEKVYMPGKDPRKNLMAYLSRCPFIVTPRRGWYWYDAALLQAAEASLANEQQGGPG